MAVILSNQIMHLQGRVLLVFGILITNYMMLLLSCTVKGQLVGIRNYDGALCYLIQFF